MFYYASGHLDYHGDDKEAFYRLAPSALEVRDTSNEPHEHLFFFHADIHSLNVYQKWEHANTYSS